MNYSIIGIKKRIMRKIILISTLVLLSLLGCTNEVEMNRRDYIIENATNFKVYIKFYGRVSGNLKGQTSRVLNNKGEQLSQKVEQTSDFDDSTSNAIFKAYEGDSVRVIINDSKVYTNTFHPFNNTFSEPINRNLFRHSNYDDIGNETYVFKITEQDYENAEDCNGNCE